ncbi:MAG: L-serine ammonia-lyase, iron-sulfur-dependent subunit beta [Faecalibacterium sp.]|nr:L-serine ammonia-lyase, iron-sulfur-dependent subunit beta [Faecalibacterium sp.]
MNVFDMIGPVMIGPSSSHTAGAARIGYIASMLLGEPPARAEILLHGSFARTYKGHGTDKALIAGILGMRPDDGRIRFSPQIAAQQGLEFTLTPGEIDGAHPNTAHITLWGKSGKQISLQGASIGGGSVQITQVNGMAVQISGQYTTFIVLHKDAPGTIAAVTEMMAQQQVNICNFSLSRLEKGGTACMTIEVDTQIDPGLNDAIGKLPNIISSTVLMPD